MPEIELKKRTATGRAAHLLREYARYIDEHAEAIVGDIDAPNYVTEDGISVRFILSENEFPTMSVEKRFLVLNRPST